MLTFKRFKCLATFKFLSNIHFSKCSFPFLYKNKYSFCCLLLLISKPSARQKLSFWADLSGKILSPHLILLVQVSPSPRLSSNFSVFHPSLEWRWQAGILVISLSQYLCFKINVIKTKSQNMYLLFLRNFQKKSVGQELWTVFLVNVRVSCPCKGWIMLIIV